MRLRVIHLFLFLLFFAVPNPSWTFAFQGAPAIQMTPMPVDFGPGLVGAPLSKNPSCCATGILDVTNTGTATLAFGSMSTTGDFILGNNPTSPPIPLTFLGPGEKGQVVMTFLPTVAGPGTGTLTIPDNASGSPQQVPLTGVGVGPGDFGIGTANGTHSVTATAGQTANFSLNVAAATGFSGTINLTCSGLPAGAKCGALSTSVTGPTMVLAMTLPITTTAATASLRFIPLGFSFAVVAIFCLARNRRSFSTTAMILALLLLTGTLVSCGGGGNNGGGGGTPTPSGTFLFTVTGTSGSISHGSQFTLIVK